MVHAKRKRTERPKLKALGLFGNYDFSLTGELFVNS